MVSEEAKAEPSNWSLICRLIGLGWNFRGQCIRVLAVQTVMLSMSLAGLGLTGLGIDYVRYRMDPTAPPPRWWFGLAPAVTWKPMVVLGIIAGGIYANLYRQFILASEG